jgi:hypothetical protein
LLDLYNDIALSGLGSYYFLCFQGDDSEHARILEIRENPEIGINKK